MHIFLFVMAMLIPLTMIAIGYIGTCAEESKLDIRL